MATVFLYYSILPSGLTERQFLIKPKKGKIRPRSKIKWQVHLSGPGVSVRKPWSQASFLTFLIPPLCNRTASSHGGWGMYCAVGGLSLRAGFTRKWNHGVANLLPVTLYRNHVPLLLFSSLIVDLLLHRWRGMLKYSLPGPFLSL